MVVIDGITYEVPFISCKRTAEFLDKYAKRTENGDLNRKLIGVYFNYQMKFGRILDGYAYKKFYDKITEPVEYHEVTVPGTDASFTFTAYFSSITDALMKQKEGKNYWEGLTVNFTAKTPARKP